MNKIYFNAKSGLEAYQKQLDIISNNMANVNTVGFKKQQASFVDLMYTEMDESFAGLKEGHGVKLDTLETIFDQSEFQGTDRELDFAVLGEGMFSYELNDETYYTRSGNFQVINVDGNYFLGTTSGGLVHDAEGKALQLEKREDSDLLDTSTLDQRIGVVNFPYPSALERIGASSFKANEACGEAINMREVKSNTRVIRNALEVSSTELTDEMVNLIEAQKAFQFNSKLIKTADEIEEIVNNLR